MKSWHKLILCMWLSLLFAAIVYAGTFTSYNDITELAPDDQLLVYDASEGSGDQLANITVSNMWKMSWGADITENTALNTTALRGKIYLVTAACTVTLDAAADVGYGAPVILIVRDASETVTIDLDAAEKFNLKGTALAAGNTLDSPGAAGDFICLISTTDADGSGTDGYRHLGYGWADWTDGGAT